MNPITTTYKTLIAIAIIGAFSFAPTSVMAQEEGFIFGTESDSDSNSEESTTVLTGESGDPVSDKEKKEPAKKIKSVDKESQKSQKVVKPKPKDKPKPQSNKGQIPASEGEESVLSFNFLHYLIQKYKFSDVIDE